ncbi:DUF2924 domain-containing protein [Asticcacaulis solisilvae]|uniref:DUF2924 domain-containing protein n=1 Tax=Asticcacaulis solisilvae TaxID=1217274 RepID=UPI003FD7EE58
MPSKVVDVADEVSAIAIADRSILLEEWQALYGPSVPKNISTLLLRRALAHRLQEKARDGLKPALRQYLRQVAETHKPLKLIKAPEPALASGSRLIREWNGKTYEVTMLAEGQFEMDGKTYRSLTQIARMITGVAWSGPRFFGLVKVKSK